MCGQVGCQAGTGKRSCTSCAVKSRLRLDWDVSGLAGRLRYNYRVGLTADWPRIFDLAAELDKAVEIDGYPDRQDLNIDLIQLAKRAGCRISLGTDSRRSAAQVSEYSAAAALMAKMTRDRILNFMSRDELFQWIVSLREK